MPQTPILAAATAAALCLAIAPAAVAAEPACAAVQAPDQKRDAATIRRIETAWLTAEYRGDTAFLACLLDPAYQVIDAKRAAVRTRADLLARVAQNQGKTPDVPPLETTAVINGDVATAYSKMTGRKATGEAFEASYIDTYVFREGAWIAVAGVDL